jgi:hypothetical protein
MISKYGIESLIFFLFFLKNIIKNTLRGNKYVSLVFIIFGWFDMTGELARARFTKF